MIFLGVDGGGTKTSFRLVSDEGTVLAQHDGDTSYYFSVGLDGVDAVLREGIERVCDNAAISPSDIDRAFFGLPGYGEVSEYVEQLDRMPEKPLGHDRYRCDNDMVCGWAGSLGGGDGVNVVAGTGSMAYGRHASAAARVGGWGEVFGDEGSAYWIAVAGLRAFARMADGRDAVGPLHEQLRRHLDLATDLDLVDVVLNRWQSDRTRVAALARQVDAAAEQGDGAATSILDEAGRLLAEHVAAVRRQLAWPADVSLPVSWSGGVFASDRVRTAFRRGLADAGGEHDLRDPLLGPDLGAVAHAARLNDTPLRPEVLTALQHATVR